MAMFRFRAYRCWAARANPAALGFDGWEHQGPVT